MKTNTKSKNKMSKPLKHSKTVQKNSKKKIEIVPVSKAKSAEIKKKKKIELKKEKPIKEIPAPETPVAVIDDEEIEKEIIDEQKEHEEKLEEANEKKQEKEKIEKIKIKSVKKEEVKPSIDIADYKNQIEALLFACGKAMPVEMICELTGIDKRHVKKALEELKNDYESRNNSLMIYEEADAWKINVREKYLSLVRKIVADTELPRSTMETLAIIAWKSPVYQSEVVRIRGNKCYDHIAALEELGFVSKDKKGRSYVLKVTDKFFNYFDIDHGNLKQILDEIKKPIMEQEKATTQATLDGLEVVDATGGDENQKTREIFEQHEKDLLGRLEVIEVKKRVDSEEDVKNQEMFLNDFDKRIGDVSKRTDDITSDMPKRNIFAQIAEQTPENTNQETSTQNDNQTVQSATPEHQRPKSLTKKQLEKKYKEDLVKLREKMEKKK